jgi:uncharacterized protein (DUF433 family)
VKDVLELLASGAKHEEILEDYPLLEASDIVAALEYAARQAIISCCTLHNDHSTARLYSPETS